jgi:hypothetical protein
MLCKETLPATVIETLWIAREMLAGKPRCVFDVFRRKDFARKIGFDDVLKPSYFGMIEKTASRADVGINESRVGRVLPPVAEFVAIGVEDRIQTKGLDGLLLFGASLNSQGLFQREGDIH